MEDGDKTYIYGDTPQDVQRQIFLRMAEQEKLNPQQFAARIAQLDFMGQINIIEKFHQRQNTPASVFSLLTSSKEEYRQDLKNATLRRISYQPTVDYNAQFNKRKNSRDLSPHNLQPTRPKVEEKVETSFHTLYQDQTDNVQTDVTKIRDEDEDSFSDDEDVLTRVLDQDKFSDDDDILRVLSPKPALTCGTLYPPQGTAIIVQTNPAKFTQHEQGNDKNEEMEILPRIKIKPAPPPGIYYKRMRLESTTPEPKDPLDEIFDDDHDFNEIFKNDVKPTSSTQAKPSTLIKPTLNPRLERESCLDDPCLDMIFN